MPTKDVVPLEKSDDTEIEDDSEEEVGEDVAKTVAT